jgi:hypothetical protein
VKLDLVRLGLRQRAASSSFGRLAIALGAQPRLADQAQSADDRLAHAARALEHGWSRSVLVMHIEQRTLARDGKALTNFGTSLPKPQADAVSAQRLEIMRRRTEVAGSALASSKAARLVA